MIRERDSSETRDGIGSLFLLGNRAYGSGVFSARHFVYAITTAPALGFRRHLWSADDTLMHRVYKGRWADDTM